MGVYDELSNLDKKTNTPILFERSKSKKKEEKPKQPGNRGTMTPRNHDTTVSRHHDTIIELVRKAVKEFGKEAATHRFTLKEKRAIADIVHDYKKSGIKTSENEIARIAINFIIKDNKENEKSSILHKTIKALNS
jgi:hypothetical protein